MTSYLLRRLGLMIPTLLGILALNFFIIQTAPGGPVDQFIAQLSGEGDMVMERITGESSEVGTPTMDEEPNLSFTRGVSPELVLEIKKMYGFDKPVLQRFGSMLVDYATFNFGDSFFKGRSVIDLVLDCLPVSMSLGIWSTLIIYVVSIPLGIRKAVKNGSKFDAATGVAVVVANAIPVFLFAILLIVIFAGGSYLNWFPLRGLVSPRLRGSFHHRQNS